MVPTALRLSGVAVGHVSDDAEVTFWAGVAQ